MLKTEKVSLPQINHTAQRLGEILTGNTQNMARQSTYKVCEKCKIRVADALLERLCHVCFRQINFQQMPDEVKEQEYLSVIPERFIKAEMEHLKSPLIKILKNSENVLLWGPPGVGKTYALCALAKQFISEGYICKRINYELLCLRLRDTFKPISKYSEWDIIETYVNCDRLFLEDVGTTRSIDSKESDFSLRTLLVVIDMRLERCRPTYITSNKSVENLSSSFDARIGDRLHLYKIIKMEGQSKRK